jgi:hypothetical protein
MLISFAHVSAIEKLMLRVLLIVMLLKLFFTFRCECCPFYMLHHLLPCATLIFGIALGLIVHGVSRTLATASTVRELFSR